MGSKNVQFRTLKIIKIAFKKKHPKLFKTGKTFYYENLFGMSKNIRKAIFTKQKFKEFENFINFVWVFIKQF
jgi:hypothetical protein